MGSNSTVEHVCSNPFIFMNVTYFHPCLNYLLFYCHVVYSCCSCLLHMDIMSRWSFCQSFLCFSDCFTCLISCVYPHCLPVSVSLSVFLCQPTNLNMCFPCFCCILICHSIFLFNGYGWSYSIFLLMSTNPMTRPKLWKFEYIYGPSCFFIPLCTFLPGVCQFSRWCHYATQSYITKLQFWQSLMLIKHRKQIIYTHIYIKLFFDLHWC